MVKKIRHPEHCHANHVPCHPGLVSANIVCWLDVVKQGFANIRNGGGVKGDRRCGFTLAEVLITLAIIGVVAALTIPAVVKNYQEIQYKTAYKKVYSDLNRVFAQAIAFSEFPERTEYHDVNFANFVTQTLKENFKVIKDCPRGHAFECWTPADKICNDTEPNGEASAFVDAAGMVWAEYDGNRAIYLVDTNGSKPPNRFGKDRWHFTFLNRGSGGDCTITPSIPIQIRPYRFVDYLEKNNWCNFPPCYYKSWLSQ